MESLKISEAPEIQQFENVTEKEIIEINAKLKELKLLGGIIDSLREGYTRQLVVNGIKDEILLEEKLNNLEVINKDNNKEPAKTDAYKHYIEDVGEIEP